jgi:hypothetical protein
LSDANLPGPKLDLDDNRGQHVGQEHLA